MSGFIEINPAEQKKIVRMLALRDLLTRARLRGIDDEARLRMADQWSAKLDWRHTANLRKLAELSRKRSQRFERLEQVRAVERLLAPVLERARASLHLGGKR